jgi:hypothetical protein
MVQPQFHNSIITQKHNNKPININKMKMIKTIYINRNIFCKMNSNQMNNTMLLYNTTKIILIITQLKLSFNKIINNNINRIRVKLKMNNINTRY